MKGESKTVLAQCGKTASDYRERGQNMGSKARESERMLSTEGKSRISDKRAF